MTGIQSPSQASTRNGFNQAQIPALTPVVPRLAVTVEGAGTATPFAAWAIQAGRGHMVLDVTDAAEKNLVESAPAGSPCRVVVGDTGFDCETVPGLPRHGTGDAFPQSPVVVRLSNPRQLAALDALIGRQRKVHHIEICETRDVESSDRDHGLGAWAFMPCALPELSWDAVDTRQQFLGREFNAPLLITGMTGGVERGRDINRNLALAAAAAGIPMGVGSQRLALDDERFAPIFDVKKDIPGVFLIGNIGAAQLVGGRAPGAARETCLRAVEMIKADALAIHINVLQELIQPEGDRDFRGVIECIDFISRDFPVPIVVKEVGAGMDPRSALHLAETGIAALDVGGRGGTSWGWIEGLRAGDPETLALATAFRDWGLTTGSALTMARDAISAAPAHAKNIDLIATGGIRTGVDVAKAVALGATMAGVGLPLFKAALQDAGSVSRVLDQLVRGLKTVMMCTGSPDLARLSRAVMPAAPRQNPTDKTQLRDR